jgi:hypothetical protein
MLQRAVATAAALVAYGCGATPGERGSDAPPLVAIEELASPASPGSGQPNLAVGPDGRVYLTWLEPGDSARRTLRMATIESAAQGTSEWSAPITIAVGDDFFVNWADFPSLAPLPDGSLAAHWLVRTGKGAAYDIHLARSDDSGETWTPALIPHRDGTVSEHGFVSLLPEPDGGLSVVWLDGREYAAAGADTGDQDLHGEMTLRTAIIGPDGALGEELLLDGRTCDCCQTAAAWTTAGPIVAYRDRTEEEVRDIVVTRRIDGRWTEPRAVHDDGWTIAACPVNGPALAAEGDHVTLAWFTAARDTPRVRVAFSDDAGATFSPPVEVDDGAPAGRVGVVLLPDGDALVSWIERVAGDAEVRVRRVGADGVTSRPLAIASSTAERASGFPRIVRAGDRIIMAWTVPGPASQVRTLRASIR